MKNVYREKATIRTWVDLQPLNCSRKSFYGKAEIEMLDLPNMRIYNLFSYKVNVARIVICNDTINAVNFGKYSMTTTIHQKEFFKQFGFDDEEIKELLKNPIKEEEYM